MIRVFDEPAMDGGSRTHAVTNQPPALAEYNAYLQDVTLQEGIRRGDATGFEAELSALGALSGTEEARSQGHAANACPPVLHTHDRFGRRIDSVEFHPAWHWLMKTAVGYGLHAAPWREARPGAHLARAAGFFLWSQVEAGHGCPISMTYAAVPALRRQPDFAAQWEPLLTARFYDFGLRPPMQKKGLLCGMAMTEKQGGSDVRANTTRAVPDSGSGENAYRLTGHKWFCSAPMCDLFLVLAQAPGGLSCFLLPRVLPDGALNRLLIQRLKEKLGNRSNASSEIELDGAHALLLGEEGRGVSTIIEMVNHTRLDCVIGSAALMRQALAQAVHHAIHRHAFGRPLIDQPLMRNVLADLALESEAATQLFLRLARACDEAHGDVRETHIKRLGTAVAKYWVCKRGPAVAAEALECLGGNGYVEECVLPRLYREAPLNSIWEGSGNVNCLDVLRAASRQPEACEALFSEIAGARGADRRLDAAAAALEQSLADPAGQEESARRLVERMALVLQASLLVRFSPGEVADAFVASRLSREGGFAFGTLPAGTPFRQIIDRQWAL